MTLHIMNDIPTCNSPVGGDSIGERVVEEAREEDGEGEAEGEGEEGTGEEDADDIVGDSTEEAGELTTVTLSCSLLLPLLVRRCSWLWLWLLLLQELWLLLLLLQELWLL